MPGSRNRAGVWFAAWIALGAAPAVAVDFAHDVVPLLKKHCGECHTGDARQGGFSMNTRDDVLAGGDSGTPGFVAGDAATSEIIARITSDDPDYRMPSDGDPLPAEAVCERRLKSAARGGQKMQRWGWVKSTPG